MANIVDAGLRVQRIVNIYRRRFSGVTAPTSMLSLNQGGVPKSLGLSVVASNGDSVQFTDNSGVVSGMRAGETFTISTDMVDTLNITTLVFQLTDVADAIQIVWTEI